MVERQRGRRWGGAAAFRASKAMSPTVLMSRQKHVKQPFCDSTPTFITSRYATWRIYDTRGCLAFMSVQERMEMQAQQYIRARRLLFAESVDAAAPRRRPAAPPAAGSRLTRQTGATPDIRRPVACRCRARFHAPSSAMPQPLREIVTWCSSGTAAATYGNIPPPARRCCQPAAARH